MKKFLAFLISFSFMGFLLLMVAFAMAVATFVESSYGSVAARGLIYNAWWFEMFWALLGLNMLANFFRMKMYLPRHFTMGIFHLSFIIIVLGAAITRYFSFEGVMHIREGESADFILSDNDYITMEYGNNRLEKKVLLSEYDPSGFDAKFDFDGRKLTVKSVGFVQNARKTPVADESGEAMIDFVVSTGQGMESYVFRRNDQLDLGELKLAYDRADANIRFFNRNDSLFIVADRPMQLRSMAGGEMEELLAGTPAEVRLMTLYTVDGYMVLVKKFYEKAIFHVMRDPSENSLQDAVILEMSDGEHQQMVNVFGRHGQEGEPTVISLGNTELKIAYGAKPIFLPFALQLREFQLERYPGSESPSSFASELTLIDKEQNIHRDIRVFMNNTLKHRGYRFYQSSYDPDEKGTVLSVNADFWGTLVTYIGYGLLFLGIVLSLFNRHSYFHQLIKRLTNISNPLLVILFGLLLGVGTLTANGADLQNIPTLDKQLVTDFSELWVHGHDGRIEPVSTLASDVLRKVSKQSSFKGKSAEEVLLSMYLYPDVWKKVPLVKISSEQIMRELGAKDSRVALTDIFDGSGNYRIGAQVKAAYAKMPAFRNHLDKEYIYVDERVNICFMVFDGQLLTVFPTGKYSDQWLYPGATASGLAASDSLFINQSFDFLKGSLDGKGETDARKIIASVADFQQKKGVGILPSEARKKVEIFYNSFNPFKRAFPIYLATGFILLLILFVNIFRQKTMNRYIRLSLTGLIYLGFFIHTAGLILRWYASGHAPWSNGYESMVYVAWATVLAGLVFGRKYPMAIGTAAFMAGITLFVAHLNWMNPEMTNLVPVLKSYWLLVHVAIITASYGFIGLSAFLGLLVMILYAIYTEKSKEQVRRLINQLTTINELSVTLGLYMLTIGTFLGGIWANESWGRYWGWDPKETWALVSVVIYAFVAHMRLIPSLRGFYNYNFATVIGFAVILMTYFGVNYYLNGLHSYGQGSADGIHWSVYVAGVLVFALLFFSYLRSKQLDENV